MSDLRCFNKDFIREFIELYRAHPCLWKVKSKEYTDKNKKNAAYEILTEKLRTAMPEATKDTVIQKINSLRGGFRREFRKVQESQKWGAGKGEVYVPNLWYYELLEFVTDQNVARDPFANDSGDDNSISYFKSEQMDYEDSGDGSIGSYKEEDTYTESPASAVPSVLTSTRICNKRKKETESATLASDNILTIVGEKLPTSKTEDKFELVGRNVAAKLRDLPKDQCIFAERLINEVLFEAQLGTLNREAKVQINV